MLRISPLLPKQDDAPACLRLEGQVVGPWVAELRRACAEALAESGRDGRSLVIDLAGVSFLDAEALHLFAELVARSVAVSNCTAFVAEQLKGVTDVDR
jgi:anti-anti-sigma regulatory factor